MKKVLLLLLLVCGLKTIQAQRMQATIKPGTTPKTVDIYLKSSTTFSQKDDAMTFVLALPANITPAPVGVVLTPNAGVTSSGVTPNALGAVTGINGLQPTFLVNNLGSTSREVVVGVQTINGASYFIYTFIFAGTASANHDWVAGVEQRIFSIQFNGCATNCAPSAEMIVNLPNGGAQGSAYWYYQVNVLGDITNYAAPFYQNPLSTVPVNGGSTDGSLLSWIGLATPVSLPIKLSAFDAKPNGCNVTVNWQSAEEINAGFYSIERSSDATNFTEIAKVVASGFGSGKNYSFSDNAAPAGQNYYRLRLVDKDGKFAYSSVKDVALNCTGKNSVLIYPTITNGQVNIKLPAGLENSSVAIFSSTGTQVLTDISKTAFRTINLRSLASGIYLVRVLDGTKVLSTGKVILQ